VVEGRPREAKRMEICMCRVSCRTAFWQALPRFSAAHDASPRLRPPPPPPPPPGPLFFSTQHYDAPSATLAAKGKLSRSLRCRFQLIVSDCSIPLAKLLNSANRQPRHSLRAIFRPDRKARFPAELFRGQNHSQIQLQLRPLSPSHPQWRPSSISLLVRPASPCLLRLSCTIVPLDIPSSLPIHFEKRHSHCLALLRLQPVRLLKDTYSSQRRTNRSRVKQSFRCREYGNCFH
jgi:hypothetical protein